MKNFSTRFLDDSRGASAVEFALVMPLVIGLGLGTFETGLAMYERSELNEAAVAGTRAVALFGDNETQVINATRSALPGNLKNGVDIQITDEALGTQIFKKVSVSYDHGLLINFTKAIDSFPLKATRYAPLLVRTANSSTSPSPTTTPSAGSPGACNAGASASVSASASGGNATLTISGSATACGETNSTNSTQTGQNISDNTSVSAGNLNASGRGRGGSSSR